MKQPGGPFLFTEVDSKRPITRREEKLIVIEADPGPAAADRRPTRGPLPPGERSPVPAIGLN